jgi:medium-chain acyl-[acyl-carrier-protein] hydrolase
VSLASPVHRAAIPKGRGDVPAIVPKPAPLIFHVPVSPSPSVWLHRVKASPAAALRLYAFPFAGGGASAYFPWAAYLDPRIELWAIRFPGRETRLREKPLTSFAEALARLRSELVPHLASPYALIGHSLGALFAYALAHDLQVTGRAGPRALILAGARPPLHPVPEPRLAPLPDSDFVSALRDRYNGIPPAVLANPELLALVLPTLRADIAVYESYAHTAGPALTCPVAAFGGERDPLVSAADLAEWRALVAGPLTTRLFPGDHFFLQADPAAAVQATQEFLLSVR